MKATVISISVYWCNVTNCWLQEHSRTRKHQRQTWVQCSYI